MDERVSALEAELACVRAERDALAEALRSGARFQAAIESSSLATIVHQSGGSVKVHTRVGEGTSFRIFLPRGQMTPKAARYSSEPGPTRELSLETVLVCDDDDDDVRRLLIDLLNFRAYRVIEARNGKEALERVRAHDGPIHLLVTDLVMPELGGIELATQLRARDEGLRVLYVSGYSENADLLSEPLDRRTLFLAKPFLPGDLTRAVFSLLEAHPPSPR